MAHSTVNLTNPVSPKARPEASVLVLAIAAGVGVANVYYIQPVLPLVRDTFSASSEKVGLAPALRKAALTQGLLAVALGAFWSTLALMLAEPPYHLGAGVAGSFGFAGAAIGGWAWSHDGWTGVCLVGAGAGALALLRSLLPQSK